MAKNKISDLRDHLFETIEALKDPDNPMALDRAQAICQVSQTIINSAKVEIDLLKVLNGDAPITAPFFGITDDPRIPRLEAVNESRVTREDVFRRRS